MRICAYVPGTHAKENYARESFNVRQYAGLAVVVDIVRRAGYEVDYAGIATVHHYDVVLVSITSDCDWWPFVAERSRWPKGNYKVIAGGPGVLNVRPFLPWVDYFCLGRAESVIDKLIRVLDGYSEDIGPSVIESTSFSVDKRYQLNQVDAPYPHEIRLESGARYREGNLGCNHKCLFCAYTWHRKHSGGTFEYGDMWSKNENVELALLDMHEGKAVDYNKLRNTAIDGMSERLRFAVNKKITRDMLREFLVRLASCEKPHQVKFYNILGYPDETEADWWELLEDIEAADRQLLQAHGRTSFLLLSTPFRAMPGTPMACAPMSYKNYRGRVARVLGPGHKGNVFYDGKWIWAVEGMGTESLSTVIQSAIVWRGTEDDSENILRVARSKRFANASSLVKQATLERYFDVKGLFGAYTKETLPTRYLRTYAAVEKMW